jgi:hypothetical protein
MYIKYFKWYTFPAKWVFHIREFENPYELHTVPKVSQCFFTIYSYKIVTDYHNIGINKHSKLWLNKYSINFKFHLFEYELQSCLYKFLSLNYDFDYFYYFNWYKINDLYSTMLYSKILDLYIFLLVSLIYLMRLFSCLNTLKKKMYNLRKCTFLISLLYNIIKKNLNRFDNTLNLLIKYIFFLNK